MLTAVKARQQKGKEHLHIVHSHYIVQFYLFLFFKNPVSSQKFIEIYQKKYRES